MQPAGYELTEIGVAERLTTMRNVAGFYPTSSRELTEGMTLLDYIEKPAGAAGHLNEILIHQQKSVSTDPAAAVRSVTVEFGDYAKKARADGSKLVELRTTIADMTQVHPFSALAKEQSSLLDGAGQLVREHDLDLLSQNAAPPVLTVDPLRGWVRGGPTPNAYDRYTAGQPDAETAARISKVLGRIRFHEAPDLIETALEGQRSRYRFWVERLQESRAHHSARPLARTILTQLGVEPR